ncbi:MAG: bifunctional 4-hydroxy-2-oxoglutarate aldolase/2-dehydro-3-deoxy-phosphogluconate aldolase [Planctomycetes bacterium]|nr:bifunctional 4-hydroxy-2-oxoglutarate aldolase/2-dehydro-3-deoxy-phosphogluconate aldolase [Planctomycetota bacterium]
MHKLTPVLERIHDLGIVLVVRADDPAKVKPGVEAMVKGGVKAIEVTFTVANAVDVIADLAAHFKDEIVLGAGTVLNPTNAAAAISAGAGFVVSPNTDTEVIKIAKAMGAAAMPGALSPTEVITAWNAGADVVKIFPGSAVGPSYLKALHGPFPDVRLMPTGGVSLDNIPDWLGAGAFALGAGSNLFDKKMVAGGDWAGLESRARAYVEKVREFRDR